MKDSSIYSLGFLTIVAAASLLIAAALESDNSTWNDTVINNTAFENASLNFSAPNDAFANDTSINDTSNDAANETFKIGDVVNGNKSALNLNSEVKAIKDASKMGYIIQSTPHGKV